MKVLAIAPVLELPAPAPMYTLCGAELALPAPAPIAITLSAPALVPLLPTPASLVI